MGDDDIKIPARHAAEVADFFDVNGRWLLGYACLRTSYDRELAASRELAADLVQDVFIASRGPLGYRHRPSGSRKSAGRHKRWPP